MNYTCNYCQNLLMLLPGNSDGDNSLINHYKCNDCEIRYSMYTRNNRLYCMLIYITPEATLHVDPLLNKVPYIRYCKANVVKCIDLNNDLLFLSFQNIIKYCKSILNLKAFL